ncbi:MAG: hypothetical protein MUC68_04700 [Burkholderiaceae bacterium]|jgi:hypothetical protein|nr:hypothetical protein [Burkholderiaceae bacterium]
MVGCSSTFDAGAEVAAETRASIAASARVEPRRGAVFAVVVRAPPARGLCGPAALVRAVVDRPDAFGVPPRALVARAGAIRAVSDAAPSTAAVRGLDAGRVAAGDDCGGEPGGRDAGRDKGPDDGRDDGRNGRAGREPGMGRQCRHRPTDCRQSTKDN